jgi:shikimate kinase
MDMDDELVALLGMSIDHWVRLHGWEAFRREESRLLQDLAGRDRIVLATGGGVVLEPVNRAVLREVFQVIWLKAGKETILSRITSDARSAVYRPPLTGLPLDEEIEEVLEARLPLYHEAAGHSIEVDQLAPGVIVSRLLQLLQSVDDSEERA